MSSNGTTGNTSLVCLGYSSVYVNFAAQVRIHAIVLAVANALFAVLATAGNVLVIWTFLKTPVLHTSSNFLLGNLCLTDLIVGCVTQPLTVMKLAQEAAEIHYCTLKKVLSSLAVVSCSSSVIIVAVISIDRCFAISFPFKYQRVISPRLYAKVLTPMLVGNILFSVLMAVRVIEESTYWFVLFIGFAIAFVTVSVSYTIIFRTVIRQGRSTRVKIGEVRAASNTNGDVTSGIELKDNELIAKTGGVPNDGKTNAKSCHENDANTKSKSDCCQTVLNKPKVNSSGEARGERAEFICSRPQGGSLRARAISKGSLSESAEKRGAITVAIVILTLTFCYTPFVVILALNSLFQGNGEAEYIYTVWTSTLIFLNSTLNPVIYCYRNDIIRASVLRKLNFSAS